MGLQGIIFTSLLVAVSGGDPSAAGACPAPDTAATPSPLELDVEFGEAADADTTELWLLQMSHERVADQTASNQSDPMRRTPRTHELHAASDVRASAQELHAAPTPKPHAHPAPTANASSEVVLMDVSSGISFGNVWSIIMTILLLVIVVALAYVCYAHYYKKQSFEDIGHTFDHKEEHAKAQVNAGARRARRAFSSEKERAAERPGGGGAFVARLPPTRHPPAPLPVALQPLQRK
eukprot:CAMPEP_0179312802 /NCGR_PEP_ID=MMETSP0797-20121207/53468_1 /TAXON_ID=47934 /ORGANISM="Dinophysis acuminata, Strain DAEP01" /LENGTH=235 /DNA_ID=CAMNT_0021022775 /DNA_START=39 /DNA_END=745 /DNA_ORIENTATION=-